MSVTSEYERRVSERNAQRGFAGPLACSSCGGPSYTGRCTPCREGRGPLVKGGQAQTGADVDRVGSRLAVAVLLFAACVVAGAVLLVARAQGLL